MQGLSHHLTISIGKRYQSKFPMHFVCGFPRSGTTWFSEMLADYLNLPRPRHYILPIGFASVIHTHSEPNAGINDCFYVIRDGRDAITSMYFYFGKSMKEQNIVGRDWLSRVFDNQFETMNVDKYLPRFIEYIFKHPVGTKSHWGDHTRGWLGIQSEQSPGSIVVVRFEALLEDTASSFEHALISKYQCIDCEFAKEAVNRQTFRRQKKRSMDQQRTLLRKGISGDWKNYWNRECGQIFDYFAGEDLIELGYEIDRSWIDSM